MRWISVLSAEDVSGPVAMMLEAVLVLVEAGDFLADDTDCCFSGDGFGDAAGEFDAIDGEGVACGDGGFVSNAQKSGTAAAHLLLEEPGRGVGRLAFERVRADELAKVDRLVGGRETGLAIDHGAHLIEVDFAAETRGGECSFRAGKAAADDPNPHDAASSMVAGAAAPASFRSASPVTRTLRQVSKNSAPIAW